MKSQSFQYCCRVVIMSVGWTLIASTVVRADDKYFIGLQSGGFWTNPENWTGGSVPMPDDTAWILNFDERNRNITYGVPIPGVPISISVASLYIGNSGGGLNTFTQTSNLTVVKEVIGIGSILFPSPSYISNSHGAHVQIAGTNNVETLWLADYNSAQSPSSGRYVLNGGH